MILKTAIVKYIKHKYFNYKGYIYMSFENNYNPVLLNIAMSCVDAIKKDDVVDLDDMWKGRALRFFKGLAETCHQFDFKDDLSCMWNINYLASACQKGGELSQYLIDLPDFNFSEPAQVDSFKQHFWLLSKFNDVMLSATSDYQNMQNTSDI